MKLVLMLTVMFFSLSTCKTDEPMSRAKGRPDGSQDTSIIEFYIGKLDDKAETDFRIWKDTANPGQVLAAVKLSENEEYINLYPMGQKLFSGSWIMTSDPQGNYENAKIIVNAGFNEQEVMGTAWAHSLKLTQYTGSFTGTVVDNKQDKAQYTFTFDTFGDVGALFSSQPNGTIEGTTFGPDDKLWLTFGKPRCSCPDSYEYSAGDSGLSIYMHEDKPFAMFYFAGAGFIKGGKKILDSYTDKTANLANEDAAIKIESLTFKAKK